MDIFLPIIKHLEDLGLDTAIENDSLLFQHNTASLIINVFNKSQGDQLIFQVDFVFTTQELNGENIIESFSSWGETEEDALAMACNSFLNSSFPLLLKTYLGIEHDGVSEETIKVKSIKWNLYISPALCIGEGSEDYISYLYTYLLSYLEQKETKLKKHWIRAFVASTSQKVITEVLFDNENWEELEDELKNGMQPNINDTYSSVRLAVSLVPIVH
ncbi:MAG: hypothetical protein COX62_00710 [Deltaproteobacteria bacterium CG_4_10_14_0_2_um_filter_43_8]|nr:MAG: hypothetical protein COV43_03675 [Deltaproteobacteria bacterium CG11_big_fil_rev_8_21_14_0_20_42_23]PJA22123.1 MAG: hypothetical protein COX62_00710 [Deltaproteobacteria bacterium CG_4_10_14_0_2_um_filter_43_8]PJC64823.1 MAG: hypothetical protein CO021_02285 [Deltaproteobacteria bacterium CG_4_9_14_0_2_um_filter_42_21]